MGFSVVGIRLSVVVGCNVVTCFCFLASRFAWVDTLAAITVTVVVVVTMGHVLWDGRQRGNCFCYLNGTLLQWRAVASIYVMDTLWGATWTNCHGSG